MRGQRNTVRFFPHHGVAAFFVVAALALMLSGCGLPTSEYLYPPDFSYDGSIFRLTHNKSNVDDVDNLFLGYDIYYRVFDDYTSASASQSQLVSWSSSYTAQQFMSLATSSSSYPYVRLIRLSSSTSTSTDRTVPLLSKTLFSNDQIFNLRLSGWQLEADADTQPTGLPYSIVRNKTSSSYASFNSMSSYESTDNDYSGSDSPSQVYLVFFAVSIGKSDDSIGMTLYSEPSIADVATYSP